MFARDPAHFEEQTEAQITQIMNERGERSARWNGNIASSKNDYPEQIIVKGDISKTLTRYATDADPETRQIYGRALLQILRQCPLEDILNHIHDIASTLLVVSEDKSPYVRSDLVEQIPYFFLQCHEHACPDLEHYLYDRLLKIIFQYLQDEEQEVCREANLALHLLLQKYLIDKTRIEGKLCPVLINLSKIDTNSQTESTVNPITLMGRVAPIIGPEKTAELLLDHFLEMCTWDRNGVRRSCAVVFPMFCHVMGTKVTENRLLPFFFQLCEDVFWGVRKACTETITIISLICSLECRRERLTPVVLKLLNDSSKWVVGSTLKILGQFISTFANPCITGLAYSYNGYLHIINPADSDFRDHSDPQIVSNYEYYLKMFSDTALSGQQESNRSKDDDRWDDSSQQIALKIKENKEQLLKQINDDMYTRKMLLDTTMSDSSNSNRNNMILNNNINFNNNNNFNSSHNNGNLYRQPMGDYVSRGTSPSSSSSTSGLCQQRQRRFQNFDPDFNEELQKGDFYDEIDDFLSTMGKDFMCSAEAAPPATPSTDSTPDSVLVPEVSASADIATDSPVNTESQWNDEEKTDRQWNDGNSSTDPAENQPVTNFEPSTTTVATGSIETPVITVSSPPKQQSQHTGQYLWKKNTPADLQSIIKEAIAGIHDENKKKKRRLRSTCGTMEGDWKQPMQTPQTAAPTSDDQDLFSAFKSIERNDNSATTTAVSDSNDNKIDVAESRTVAVDNDDDQKNDNKDSDDEDALKEFNSHQYWYISPEIPVTELDLIGFKSDNSTINSNGDYYSDNGNETNTLRKKKTMSFSDIMNTAIRFVPPTDYEQNIVPVGVLENFVKMVLYEEDDEMNINCAYNFPAVALTLGRTNWHIIKPLLKYLCDDLDWKVRKTVASSIDLLAMILGPEITTNDLVPIYLGLFKDLDEVKIEAIRKFANFLEYVNPPKREEVLSNIGICLRVDSRTNWRIREDLAKQVVLLIKMYESINNRDCLWYLTSLTALFLEDKVSCVREIASDAMVDIIQISSWNQQIGIVKHFLIPEFSSSDNWRQRQTFVNIIFKLAKAKHKEIIELFNLVADEFKQRAQDAVPNIRILVAKTLVQLISLDPSLKTENEQIEEMVKFLAKDQDNDVSRLIWTVSPPPEPEEKPEPEHESESATEQEEPEKQAEQGAEPEHTPESDPDKQSYGPWC